MKLSVKSRYALYIMLDLAERYATGASVRDVAERQSIPVKYAEKLFGILKRAGLVTVSRGATGGYRLSREPDRIRALDVVRLMEGGNMPCADDCGRADKCRVRILWERLRRAEEQALGVTLADMLYSEP